MIVPFVDLKRQHKLLEEEILVEIKNVACNSMFILGNEVDKFEDNFSKYCGTQYGIGVASGSDALFLILKSLNIGIGDEVITVSNTFIATANAVVQCGAHPIFVDIDEATFNINVKKIEEKISKKTKAIIIVHLFGRPGEVNDVMALASKYNIAVVEDSCQAHGARYKGEMVGSYGIASAFSFYPGKNLGAWGDGGIVVTNNSEIAKKIKIMRNYGQTRKYNHNFFGINSRLDEIQAAILNVKLRHLNAWNILRRKWAQTYCTLLKDIEEIILPSENEHEFSVFHVYAVRVKRRDQLQAFLSQKGISTNIHYPIPIHLQESYKQYGYKYGDLPVTERISNELLSLPLFPEINDNEINYVVSSIRSFYKKNV